LDIGSNKNPAGFNVTLLLQYLDTYCTEFFPVDLQTC
jgi:hypothetical protein